MESIEELVKELNGKVIEKWSMPRWVGSPHFPVLILADMERGITVKPYFETEQEWVNLAERRRTNFGGSLDEHLEVVKSPEYCLCALRSQKLTVEDLWVVKEALAMKGSGSFYDIFPGGGIPGYTCPLSK